MPESTRQLRLLPAPQPLVERWGAEFFRQVPRSPGVYRFLSDAGELLYVGKARDLHARLSSYRRTHGQSRKTIRLIHAAGRIEWELCASETEARLRENELIRTLRPRFNRVGTWPRSARYLVLERTSGGFQLDVSAEPGTGGNLETFGAFRGGVGWALAALARLLALAWNPGVLPLGLPRALIATDALRRWEADHPSAASWVDDVAEFLSGAGDRLVARLAEVVAEPDSPFERAFVASQFEVLMEFQRRGPVRNRWLRERAGVEPALLAPEQLDDLAVVVPPPSRPEAFRPDDVLPAVPTLLFES